MKPDNLITERQVAAMDDMIDAPEYQSLIMGRVISASGILPPVVSPEVPDLTQDERTACFMASKRLMDAAWTGDRTQLQCALGYLKGL